MLKPKDLFKVNQNYTLGYTTNPDPTRISFPGRGFAGNMFPPAERREPDDVVRRAPAEGGLLPN